MAIAFKDFFPAEIDREGNSPDEQYHAYLQAAQRATTWVEEMDIQVINIETLTLPNFFHPQTREKKAGPDASPHAVFQFVRVWYHAS